MPHSPADDDGLGPIDVPAVDGPAGDAEPIAAAGRGAGGASPKRPGKAAESRAAKKIKGRTIYLHDDLFERLLVQAHRRGKTISEYVGAILERQVPDHNRGPRTGRPDSTEGEAA